MLKIAYQLGVQKAFSEAGLAKQGEENYTGRRILGGIMLPGLGAVFPGLAGGVMGGGVGGLGSAALARRYLGSKAAIPAGVIGGLGGMLGGAKLLGIPDEPDEQEDMEG